MKKLVTISILAAMVAAGSVIKAQDRPPEYLGLPGDNLNLYAVMKLFQESKTLEDFERDLNDKNSNINNLDLNGDRKVDYITVTDNVNGNVHNIVLQDAVSKDEVQDVAVFTVERLDNGGVQIQLTGDEDLYGKNYIIEPNYEEQAGTPNPGYTGDNTVVYGRNVTIIRTTPVYIADWPLIRFIFSPHYVVWHSRWYWGYYPHYWYSWEPYYWDYYYGFHYNWYNHYYGWYRLCNYHRYHDWDNVYYHRERHYSRFVSDRIRTDYYKETYSRPETRRQGEEAYNKVHRDTDRRSNLSNTNSTERRSGNVSTTERRSSVSNNNRSERNEMNRNTERSSNSSRNSNINRNSDNNRNSNANRNSNNSRNSNVSNRKPSVNKETKSDDKKKNESVSRTRREPVVMNRSTYSAGNNNRYAYNQSSSKGSITGNRSAYGSNNRSSSGSGFRSSSGPNIRSSSGSNIRSSSGQTRSSGNFSGRSGVSRSSSSVSHSSPSKGNSSSGSKSEKSSSSSHRR